MKVLFVTWNFPPRVGGAERLAAELTIALRDRHVVETLTGRGSAPGVGTDRLRSPLPGVLGFLAWLTWQLPCRLVRSRPDLVVGFGAWIGAFCRPFNAIFRIPEAVIVLGTDVAHRNRLYRAWLRLALRGVTRVVAISSAAAAAARSAGVRPETLEILPPALDDRFAESPGIAKSLPPTRLPVLLYVGRVIPRKGLLPFVANALPLILAEREVELWVIGDDATASLAHPPGELARVRAEVESDGLGERVRFLGRVDEATLRDAYRRATLFVLPAVEVPGDIEGFGLVLLEAALFGLPAVATRLGGVPDAIVDGETGVLVTPSDWLDYARQVLRLLADEPLRQRLGRRARERAASEFGWERVGARWCEALERTAHGPKPTRDT